MQESSVNQQLMNKPKAQLQEDFYTNFKIVDITLTPPAIKELLYLVHTKNQPLLLKTLMLRKYRLPYPSPFFFLLTI